MKIIKKEDRDYPQRLLELKNIPSKLYVEGNEKLLNNNSLAIVGSRKCSQYGIKNTKEFAKTIASYNITIISGLAIGIDTIAHQTAKEYEGNTIAVLGSGLNNIYPKENKKLVKEILKNDGCVISEYEPNEKVNMNNFPKRNKIISGISNGILVIEAGYRSGSTITGRIGLKQNKNVYCLPREIGNPKGIGTNKLIQIGAKLVTNPNEILEQYGIKYIKKEKEINNKKESKEIVPKEYKNTYNLVTYNPQNIQQIIKNSDEKIEELTQKLSILELQGYIKSLPGNYYIRI